jgi:bacterioferritin-associated ferredoxin
MYLCICNAVSEDQLRKAYARTGCWKQAASECGAGENCGGCMESIEEFFGRPAEKLSFPLPVLAA